MPVISISHGKSPHYMRNLTGDRFIKPMGVIYETEKTVMATALKYETPITESKKLSEQEVKVDKVKKDN